MVRVSTTNQPKDNKMSKEHWKAIEQRDVAVDEWNKQVEEWLDANGTYTAERAIRKYHIERDKDGFVGWWDDDHSHTTHADTPFEVLCDLP
jgi:uncharacterized protein YydD (DUF2326 family)